MKSVYQGTRDWPYHTSAGGVVYREKDGKLEYALLHRQPGVGVKPFEHETWHIPKGTLEAGETLEQCALREVLEEAGLISEVVGYLGVINRQYHYVITHQYVDKTVHYFLLKLIKSGEGKIDAAHDRLDWLGPADAIAKLKLAKRKAEEVIIQRAEDFRLKFPQKI